MCVCLLFIRYESFSNQISMERTDESGGRTKRTSWKMLNQSIELKGTETGDDSWYKQSDQIWLIRAAENVLLLKQCQMFPVWKCFCVTFLKSFMLCKNRKTNYETSSNTKQLLHLHIRSSDCAERGPLRNHGKTFTEVWSPTCLSCAITDFFTLSFSTEESSHLLDSGAPELVNTSQR